jgi:hypothetical protein
MKYFCSYDRTFISDTFKGTFTDITGKTISGDISGASVLIAVIPLKQSTGEPIYYDKETEGSYNINFFDASINPNLGAVIIPNTAAFCTLPDDILISGRIVEYTIDIWEKPYLTASCAVTEDTFKQFIHDNYKYFNNSNNYYAQTTSYKCFPVDKEYSRTSYRIGYNAKSEPVIEEYGQPHSDIVHFYSSARTMEAAQERALELKGKTPDEMYVQVQRRNQQIAEKTLQDYSKS